MDLGIYTIQFAMLVFGNEMPEEINTSVIKNEEGQCSYLLKIPKNIYIRQRATKTGRNTKWEQTRFL